MKTVDEKATKICKEIKLPTDGPAFVKIRMALKEQDRDTRHACAEAVIKLDSRQFGGEINKDEAHAACMNVQSV